MVVSRNPPKSRDSYIIIYGYQKLKFSTIFRFDNTNL